MTLVIEDTHDLDRTARLASWFTRPEVGHVHVRLPWLDHAEQLRSGRAVAAYFNECGYMWGGPTFLSVLAWGAVGAPWEGLGYATALGVSFGAATAAAAAAKVSAMVWSQWRLQVLLARLARGGVIKQRA